MMDVPRDKLGLAGTGNAEVLNVKCAPLLVGSLWLQAGFLPAYHMNKSSWVSILLNGTVSNEEIKNLIDMSYTLFRQRGGASHGIARINACFKKWKQAHPRKIGNAGRPFFIGMRGMAKKRRRPGRLGPC